MLSLANHTLVQQDHALPGLVSILDKQRLKEILLSQNRISIDQDVTASYFRYKPNRRCIALYYVHSASEASSALPDMLVATARTQEGWAKYQETNIKDSVGETNKLERTPIRISDERLSIEWFPFDRSLSTIAKLVNNDRRRKVLGRVLGKDCEQDVSTLRMLTYKPGRRYVVALEYESKPKFTLKLHTRSDYVGAAFRTRFAHQNGLCQAKHISMNAHYGVIATEWLPGTTLNTMMGAPGCDNQVLERVGEELSQWHQRGRYSNLESLPKPKLTLVASTRELANDIGTICPNLRERCERLGQWISANESLLNVKSDVIHGDFYSKQVLVDQGAIRLIDFDQLSCGDAHQDVANFIGHIAWSLVQGEISSSQANEFSESFLKGYRDKTNSIHSEVLNIYTAIAILRCVPHPFRRGLEDWPARSERLLTLAENAILAKTNVPLFARTNATSCTAMRKINKIDQEENRSVSVQHLSTSGRSDFNLLDCLRLDHVQRVWTQPETQLCAEIQGSRVISATPMRHKTGRRILVEYAIHRKQGIEDCVETIVGKSRQRGFDDRTSKLHRDLETLGFAEHGLIRVPKWLGNIPNLNMWLQSKSLGCQIDLFSHSDSQLHVRIAKALSLFHQCQLNPLRHYTVADEVRMLEKHFAILHEAMPDWELELSTIWKKCLRWLDLAGGSSTGFVHRDFYFDQVLSEKNWIVFLDLDLVCLGPLELDVGNYIAHLHEYAYRKPEVREYCNNSADQFLEEYCKQSQGVSRIAIQAWTKLALARHLYLSTVLPDRGHTTRPILDHLCS